MSSTRPRTATANPADQLGGAVRRSIGVAFAGTALMLAFTAYTLTDLAASAETGNRSRPTATVPAPDLRLAPAVPPVATIRQR